jgi:hypothetical protein
MCIEVETRSDPEIKQAKFDIAKYLFERVRNDPFIYDDRKYMNRFIILMYCYNAEYAKTIPFEGIHLDLAMLNKLTDYEDVDELLKIATMDTNINEGNLHHIVSSDRIDLIEYIYTQIPLRVDQLKKHLLVSVYCSEAVKIARFFYRHGITWRDVYSDGHSAKWFMSVTEQS